MAEDVFGIVGATLGNFHVERVIAEGGFGVVYRAQHGAFRAPVALKCLKVPGGMSPEQQTLFLEKFREEAELLFRLSASIAEVVRPLHADVVHLPDGRFAPYLALEWLEGESLDRIIATRRERGQAPMGLHKLVRLLRPIAQALMRAHRFPGPTGPMAIIHRDIKPDNIFVQTGGGVSSVKILDFGIAAAKSATTRIAGRSTGEDPLGAFTPAYAAPEQWVPKRYGQSGPWTDVWGLAITMVEALAGHQPIDGDLTTMMGTVLDERRRPTPRNENVVISNEVDAVFERALAVDPRERIKDVDTFWASLERAIGIPVSSGTVDARREEPDVPASSPLSIRSLLGGSSAPPREDVVVPRTMPSARAEAVPHLPELELDLGPRPTPRGLVDAHAARAFAPSSAPVSTPAAGGAATPASSVPTVPSASVHVPQAPPSSPGTAGLSAGTAGLSAAFVSDARIAAAPVSTPGSAPIASAASLELVPLGAPPVSRPRTGATFAPSARSRLAEAEMSRLRDKLRLPIKLIVVALGITVIDLSVAAVKGELLFVGPVRPLWVAAPLVLVGVSLAVWRVFGQSSDD